MRKNKFAQIGIFLFILACLLDMASTQPKMPAIAGSSMIADISWDCHYLRPPPKWWFIPTAAVFVVIQSLVAFTKGSWIFVSRKRACIFLLCSAVVILAPIGAWQYEENAWEHSCETISNC